MRKNFALEIESIITRLEPIRREVLQAEQHFRKELDQVYPANLQSARNLVHYVGLRRHDIRELQEDLGRLALSSLGRLESHVIATLDALVALLYRLAGKTWNGPTIEETLPNSIPAQRSSRNTRLNRWARPRTVGMCALW